MTFEGEQQQKNVLKNIYTGKYYKYKPKYKIKGLKQKKCRNVYTGHFVFVKELHIKQQG